jgi:hypothetical protein
MRGVDIGDLVVPEGLTVLVSRTGPVVPGPRVAGVFTHAHPVAGGDVVRGGHAP